jgi:uncharacterized protein (TIGR02145 family)
MKRLAALTFTGLFSLLLLCGCGRQPGTVTDVSGKNYRTIAIGGRIWTGENLDVDRYRNGDPIPEVRNPEAWARLTTGAWCWYKNRPENGKIYGKLYNWYAVNDPRGLAPRGWHVATDADWNSLLESLGGEELAGGVLKAARLWKEPQSESGDSGFDLLPAGARRDSDGDFVLLGEYCRMWSSMESSPGKACGRAVGYFDPIVRRGEAGKRLGFAVRCVRD